MTDIEQKFSEGVAREIFLGCWDGDRETGIQAWEDETEMSREPYIKDAIKYLSLVIDGECLAIVDLKSEFTIGTGCPHPVVALLGKEATNVVQKTQKQNDF